MNMLESLDTLGFSHFKKLLDLIIPLKERRQSEIIISYIRIYSRLNTAFDLLNKDNCKRAFEHLSISKKILKQLKFNEEKPYLRRIANILNRILKNENKIIQGIKREETSDPFHVKTSVLLAQNICILRILKINKY